MEVRINTRMYTGVEMSVYLFVADAHIGVLRPRLFGLFFEWG